MKIGNKSVPTTRLPESIEAVKTIYGKFGSKEIDDETVSSLLGHSTSRSGAYKQKVADMRSFGLIDPRGNIRVTERGRKVSYPNNQTEEQEALIDAIREIELWKFIYDKYTKKGLTLPSDFWTDIRLWTGLPPEEAKNQTKSVKKLYLEDTKYIKPEFEFKKEEAELGAGKIDTSTAISEGVLARFTLKDIGYVDVKDKDTYDIAKAYLKVLAKKLGITEKEG